MSIRDERGLAAKPAGDQNVADYLADHPDFFERHAGLLERLRLPHRTGSATVSLVERQVAVLQDKNRVLERRLRELVDVARSNTTLSDKVHALAIRLLRATDAASVLAGLECGLREDFGASQAVVVLLHNTSEIVQGPSTRFLRTADRADPALKAFATFIQQSRPRCGRVRDVQRMINQDRNYFAATLVAKGRADAMVAGVTRNFNMALKEVQRVLDVEDTLIGLSILLAKGRTLFVADTTIHELPNAEELADIAVKAAETVRKLGRNPRVAFLSYSRALTGIAVHTPDCATSCPGCAADGTGGSTGAGSFGSFHPAGAAACPAADGFSGSSSTSPMNCALAICLSMAAGSGSGWV